MLRTFTLAACAAIVLLAAGCVSAPSDTSAADAKAIQAKSELWSKAGSTKDSASFCTFYADDATVMIPNEPAFKGMKDIQAVFTPMMQDPNFKLSFTTDKVEVSGILAYTQGAYSMTTTARTGKPVEDRGKYLTVWKKQTDGTWKALEDIFNTDLPPA
jgi:ketosteroid isomerase-like protein